MKEKVAIHALQWLGEFRSFAVKQFTQSNFTENKLNSAFKELSIDMQIHWIPSTTTELLQFEVDPLHLRQLQSFAWKMKPLLFSPKQQNPKLNYPIIDICVDTTKPNEKFDQ